MKMLAMLILLSGTSAFAFAGSPVPEIDANAATAGVAIVLGGLLVFRARRKQ